MQKRAESELTRLAKEGVAVEHFDKAKEALVKGHEVDLKRNRFWLQSLDKLYLNGQKPDDITNLGKAIDALTAEDVAAAAERYLDTGKSVIGVHLPK